MREHRPSAERTNRADGAHAGTRRSTTAHCQRRVGAQRGPGPRDGERALPFALVDQHGQTRALDEWLGKGLVAVVFYRSADW